MSERYFIRESDNSYKRRQLAAGAEPFRAKLSPFCSLASANLLYKAVRPSIIIANERSE